MQFVSNDKAVSYTVQDLQDFNPQFLATQAKIRKELASMMPDIKKTFDFKGDDIIELSSENDSLKNKKGSYDQKWLDESKARM